MIDELGEDFAGGVVADDPEDELLVKKKITPKSVFFAFFGAIAGSVQRCIPILIGAGMLECLYLILAAAGILSEESSTYAVLEFAANAGFYFLPVYVGFNCANKHGGNPLLGAFIGCMLLHPNFAAMIAAGEPITLLGIPVRAAEYGSSVLPAFVAVYVMCIVEKWIVKHSPKNVRVVTEPFGTLLVMVPLTLWILAPIGDYASVAIQMFLEFVQKVAGPFAPAIVGLLIPFLVVTGTHLVLGSLAIMSIMSVGQDCLMMPGALLHNFIHGALALGIFFKTKDPEMRSLAGSCSFTAYIAGISEPSLYGLALKNKTALAALEIGQVVGCLYFGFTKTGIYMFPGGGLSFFSLAAYLGGPMSNFVNAVIGTVLGMLAAFIFILVFYKDGKGDIES